MAVYRHKHSPAGAETVGGFIGRRGLAVAGMAAEEPRTALAAFFQLRGLGAISESEFVLETSYKLRWFTPKEAQRLLQLGLDHGLLRVGAGNVEAAFDVNTVTVPVNYRPGPEALAVRRPVELFPLLLTRLEATTGQGRQALVARINDAQQRLGVDAEVAAAHVARELGIDVSDILPELESEVLRRAR